MACAACDVQTCHGAIQFTVYEELKYLARRFGVEADRQQPDRTITSLETSLYAATSKLAASVTTYPAQVTGQQGRGTGRRGRGAGDGDEACRQQYMYRSA